MIISFPVLTLTRPLGGAIPPYETANAMRRRGHSVHVLHVGMEKQIRSLDDVRWIDFEDGIEHVFPGAGRTPAGDLPPDKSEITLTGGGGQLAALADYLPAADFIAAYDEGIPSRHGLPFVFIQGYWPHTSAIYDLAFRSPCPKVCVSKWLVDIGRQNGVRAEELVYVPNGVKHDKYRLASPIDTRFPLVSTAYHNHPHKRPTEALAVLDEVKRRVPEVEAIVFSQIPPVHETASWMTVVTNPPQEMIVKEIYNRSRVFLCASRNEGFGFPSIEAMACGAALVTTANGGSADYAIDGETALVCQPGDMIGLADSVERLLRDDELRIRLARQGMEYVREHFDWDASAGRLEAFLSEYAAYPGRFGHR
jgi:glycosyltransferase involved in cell wall biosynthesis